MKTRQRSNSKKYGPNIVRAWFDTVFQYVLARLESERGYLERRNWSYRFYKQALDYVVSLGEHMPASARANLEQFSMFFPEVNDLLEEHDRKVADLTLACASFHEAIVRDSRFREVFAGVETESQVEFGVDFGSHFGAFSTRGDFASILAEHMVNNLAALPSFHATSRLWNRFRDRFVPVAASPELEPYRLASEICGRELLEAGDKLNHKFKAIRSDLSLEFDVPFATETASAL
jgi:hypothetical protein